jgi:hypothetical protein
LTSVKVGGFASQRLAVFLSNFGIPRHNLKAGEYFRVADKLMGDRK